MGVVGRLQAIGIDLGTSTIKISFGTRKLRFPSVIGEPRPGFRGLIEDKSLLSNLVIEHKGREWYVGELARLQSTTKRWLAREGLVKSVEDAIIAVKAALALVLTQKENYVVVTTGVPVGTGSKKMEELGNALKGTHTITVKNDATGEKRTITVHVVACPVLPEPYGTWYYMLRSIGEKKAKDSIIIDIGFGSTDFLTIYKGRILGTASGSIREAVDTLASRLADWLAEQTGKFVEPESLIQVIESPKKLVSISGMVYDISKQIEEISRFIAGIIVDRLEALLDRLPPDAIISYYILTGGGSYVFGKYIRDVMLERKLVRSASQILIPPDPIMANCIGFELISEHYAGRLMKTS